MFLDVLGIGLIIPVLPGLVTSLAGGDVSDASRTYGLFVSVYAAMQFLCAPLLGALSDRFGRRPVLLLSLLGAGLDYLVLAVAPTLGWLFAARVVAGVTAANLTVANAYIADVTPPDARARSFGLLGAMFGLGFIVAPAVGGLLGAIHLRLPFVVAAVVVLLNCLYGLFVLPESLPREQRRPFAWRAANPVTSVARLRKYPEVLGFLAIVVVSNLAFFSLQSVWVLSTTLRFAWTPAQNGWTLALFGVTTALVQGGLVRVLVPRLGERRAVVAGLCSSVLAFAVYGLAPTGAFMFVGIVIGALGGLTNPSVQALISREIAADEQGSVQGAIASVASLTAIASPLLATNLFAYFTGPSAPVPLPGAPFLVGSALLAVALGLAFRRRGPAVSTEERAPTPAAARPSP